MPKGFRPVLLLVAVVVVTGSASAQAGKAQFEAGRTALERNEYDAAIPLLERAVREDTANAVFHFWLGNAYGAKAQNGNVFAKIKYGGKVRGEFLRAEELNPEYYDAHAGLYAFYTQAPAIIGGSAESATRERAAMIRIRPYPATLQFATEDVQRRAYDAAIAALTALWGQHPDSVAVPVELAVAETAAERYADAWAVLDAARKRAPTDPQLDYAVGRTAAISANRLAEGADALHRFLLNHPASTPTAFLTGAHYRLGMIREHQGNRVAARKEYSAAVALDSSFAQARAALEHLGS